MPPNCRFELDDAAQDWTFPDNTFDYIHLRFMSGCFKDWVKLYKECFRCLKPGGWLEHQEFSPAMRSDDNSIPKDSIWSEWMSIFIKAGERTGRTFEVVGDDNWVKWMEEAGFTGIRTKMIKTPVGGWPADTKLKAIGHLNKAAFETSLEGYTIHLLTNVMGWTIAEVQLWLAKVRDALRNKDYHGYSTW